MGIYQFLNDLRRDGVRLWLEGEEVRFSAPKGVMSPERLSELRGMRQDILHVMKGSAAERPSPIVAQDRGRPLPLSYAQERLWVIQERGQDQTYTMVGALTLDGPLVLNALRGALDALMERHEGLRTRFDIASGDDVPSQHIDRPVSTDIIVRDTAPEELAAAIEAIADQPFDLRRGPMTRVQLFRVSPDRHVLAFVLHVIVADGWSIGILVRDLRDLYAAELGAATSRPAPLRVHYADYACWQRGQDLGRHLAYWTSRLAGYRQKLDLGSVASAGGERGLAGMLRRSVDPSLAAGMAQFGRERQASLFTVLMTGLALAACRQTGLTDLCLGTTSSGRDDPALEPLVGFFTNILPVRIDLAGEPTGEALFDRVKAAMFDALGHQAIPFEHMLAAMPGGGRHGGETLVPVMIRHQNYPEMETGVWAGGLQAQPLTVDAPRPATSDLDLQFYGDATSLRVVAEFDTARFDQDRVEMVLDTMDLLLKRLLAEPRISLSELLAASPEERDCLRRWNATDQSFADSSLAELFNRQLRSTPDKVICRDGDATATYAELDRMSAGVARALAASGAGPGTRVALHQPRGIVFLAELVGILRAGCIYVPVDPSYPAAYVERILADADPSVILTRPGCEADLGRFATRALTIDADALTAAGPHHGDAEIAWARNSPDDVAYLAYTSGSTGRPKGVVVEHRQVLNCLQSLWASMPYAADDVVAQKTSAAFVPSIKEILGSLLAGIPQVVMSDLLARDTPSFGAALQRHRATRLYLVPSHLDVLLEHAQALGSLRDVIVAGEPLPQALRSRFEAALPDARLHNNYGCSELHDITYCGPGDQDTHGRTVPAGRPIANTRLHILNDAGRPVAPGVTGMLHVESAGVGPGYWRQPELTAERFRPGPSGRPEMRMFCTGDLARWLPDGRMECLGRNDLQIKVRGQRVDAAQVEHELSSEPSVHRSAVALGTGRLDGVLVAYVVPTANAAIDAAALHEWLDRRLPGHMVPNRFIACAELPTLPNGKLDRLSLGLIPLDDIPADGPRTAPRTTMERDIAAIWAELLELPVEQLRLEDSFFALGGHSLMATRVAARIRQHLGVELPLRVLFEARTLGALVREIETVQGLADGSDRLAAIARETPSTSAPLSRGQRMVWDSNAYKDAGRSGDVWNLAWLASIKGSFDIPALRQAFEILIDRHDILSYVFLESGDGVVQQRASKTDRFNLSVVHAAKDGIDTPEKLRDLLRQDRRGSFDWSERPLLIRALLVVQSEDEHILQFTIHHMAADAWSMVISAAELGTIYQAIRDGIDHGLPPLPLQFIDYVRWEKEEAETDRTAKQRLFWLKQLGDAPRTTGLPLDRPRPSGPLGWTERVVARLPAELSDGIRQLAREHEGTPFAILMGALNLLVWELTGQTDQVVILPTAIREHPHLEPMIGPFVNAVAVRNQVDPSRSFIDLGARIKATMTLTYENRHTPFNEIVDALVPHATPGVPPLSKILFGVVNTPPFALTLPGLQLTPLPSDARTAWFDTRINVFERPDGFVVEWDYVTDLFDHGSVERFIERYVDWIEAAVGEPEIPLVALLDKVATARA